MEPRRIPSVRTTRRAIIAASAGLLLAGCARKKQESARASTNSAGRKPAPDFELKDANGKTVSLADYRGKVVLLNFWATWCGPCKVEIPWFVEFEQKYKDRGFAVLGVSMDDEGWEVVKPYLEKNRINYRVLVGDDKIAQSYGGVESLPTTFVLDQDGHIAGQHIGLVSKSDYENEIRQLLDGRSSRLNMGAFAFLTGTDHP